MTDSKIRIFDGGNKRADVQTFPCVVHMVRAFCDVYDVCVWFVSHMHDQL